MTSSNGWPRRRSSPASRRPTLPDWVLRRLDDGLGGVVLYARNVVDREQLGDPERDAPRRARRRARRDRRGGRRRDAARGRDRQLVSGELGARRVDDVELTRRRRSGDRRASSRRRSQPRPRAGRRRATRTRRTRSSAIRSFGSDPELVARHVAAFVGGLQEAGVAACAKHFPGHGDTVEDSHLELPTRSRDARARRALRPFRAAIERRDASDHDRAHPRGRASARSRRPSAAAC